MKKILILLFFLFHNVYADVIPIVNVSSPFSELPLEELRNVYLLKTNNVYITNKFAIYQMPMKSKIHRDFINNVLRMSLTSYDNQLNKSNLKKLYIVTSAREMLDHVSANPYSIGYIDYDVLILNDDVKDVKILNITR